MLSSRVEIVDGVAVSQHDGVVAPFVAQDVYQQSVAGAAGLTLIAVVGTHHLAHIAFLYQCLESGQVGLPEVSHRDGGVISVAQWLRTAVHGIMLGAGMGLEVFVIVALHTQHGLHTEHSVQVGVFTAGLLSASPAWVTEDIDIRAPEGELGVAGIVGHAHGHIEDVVVRTVPVGAGLVGDRGEHFIHLLRIEGGSHANRLGIDGVASLAHTMAGLAPPVVGRDA